MKGGRYYLFGSILTMTLQKRLLAILLTTSIIIISPIYAQTPSLPTVGSSLIESANDGLKITSPKALDSNSSLQIGLNPYSFHAQSGYYRVDIDQFPSLEDFVKTKIDPTISNDIYIIYDSDPHNSNSGDREFITHLNNSGPVTYTLQPLEDDWGKRNNGKYSFTITRTENDHTLVSEPLTLNILFSKFEAVLGNEISSNKELHDVPENINFSELIYSVIAKHNDGVDNNKQIQILYDGNTTDGITHTIQNFATLGEFNYRFTVDLLSDYWGHNGDYLFNISNNDLKMEVTLPLTFGRPIMYADEIGSAVVYPTATDDFNNSTHVKRLFSSILTDTYGTENKVALEYGDSESTSALVTPEDFLYDDTYTAKMKPLNNNEYQFIISKTTPIETLTIAIRVYADFRNLSSTVTQPDIPLEVENNLSAQDVLQACMDANIISLSYNNIPITSLENYTVSAITSSNTASTVSGAAGKELSLAFEITHNRSFATTISPTISVAIAPIDTSKLSLQISNALFLLNSNTISADGSELTPSQSWVTPDEYAALSAQIEKAQLVAQTLTSTAEEVSAHEAALLLAANTFTSAQQPGTYTEYIDTSELSAEISHALTVIDTVTVSDDIASNVALGTVFVSSSDIQQLNELIFAAQAQVVSPTNNNTVIQTLKNLQTALIDFILNIDVGTQELQTNESLAHTHPIIISDLDTSVTTIDSDASVAVADLDNSVTTIDTDAPVAAADLDHSATTIDSDATVAVADLDNSVTTIATDAPVAVADLDTSVTTIATDDSVAVADLDNSVETIDSDASLAVADLDHSVTTIDSDASVAVADLGYLQLQKLSLSDLLQSLVADLGSSVLQLSDSGAPVAVADLDNSVTTIDSDASVAVADLDNSVTTIDSDAPVAVADLDHSVTTIDSDAPVAVADRDHAVTTIATDAPVAVADLEFGYNYSQPMLQVAGCRSRSRGYNYRFRCSSRCCRS